jgi:signal peptidase II
LKNLSTNSKAKSKYLFLSIALTVVFIDQLTKFLAVHFLNPYEPVSVLGEVLKFTLAFNSKAAFSIGPASTWVFTIISSLATLALLWFGPKFRSRDWLILGGFALGGVAGNLIDRLVRSPGFPNGHVVDFIQIPFNFPVFNIADMAISVSATLIALKVIRGDRIGGKSV